MGNRWLNHERKLCVEECAQKDARTCPACNRAVKYLYARPCPSFVPQVWACRKCHDLSYFSVRSRKTRAGDLVRVPGALRQAERELFAALASLPSFQEPPPDEVVKQGRRAVAKWFRDCKAEHNAVCRKMDMLNQIPSQLRNLALRERLPEREPNHGK